MRLPKLFFLSVACGLVLWAADPVVGTWKLNLAKSKISGAPGVKEWTLVITEQQGQFEVVSRSTGSDGSRMSARYTVPVEGGPVKYSEGGPPPGVSQEMKRVGEGKADFIVMRDGKEVQVEHAVLSPDGQTLTLTTKGATAEGQPYEAVEDLEKQ
ncbi:MAG TPA: hypothetical protein VHC72_07180 [Bryobacteraceae bacterium]|nr:hypothetical protein [Bryobacteraceae bacterium]